MQLRLRQQFLEERVDSRRASPMRRSQTRKVSRNHISGEHRLRLEAMTERNEQKGAEGRTNAGQDAVRLVFT